MANSGDFLSRLLVDEDTAARLQKMSKLLGKRPFYLKYYKVAFFEHLKNEYNDIRLTFPNVEIVPEARIKGQKSYGDKVNSAINKNTSDIYDIFGNRYIIISVNGSQKEEDIIPVLYQIRDFLAYSYSDKEVIPERIKDYIAKPKHSSYQSLHITRVHDVSGLITLSDEFKTFSTPPAFQSETQLRSYFMHYNAHQGPASHANQYKERIPGITPLPDSIEYIFDDNGFCIEVRDKPFEKAFEDFFGIVYDPTLFSSFRVK